MRRSMAVVGALALLALGGCSLGRGAAEPQVFILGGEATPENATAPRAALQGMSVGVRRLQLASYLETPFIVVRRGGQEMILSQFNRWGEPLDAGISRAVAGYLAAGAQFDAVDVAPWPARAEHDYLIELNVLRFEGVVPIDALATTGEVHSLTQWRILRAADAAVVSRGTSDFREAGWEVGDHAALVALLNSSLRELSADLLASLATLPVEARSARERPLDSLAPQAPLTVVSPPTVDPNP